MRRALGMTCLCLAAGCGLDELGVLEVEFALEPAPFPALPADVDGASVSASYGDLRADAVDGLGRVMVVGLPELSDGLSYAVIVEVAENERDSLPSGESTAAEGHTHGALLASARQAQRAAADRLGVALGDLEPNLTTGQWVSYFSSDDLQGHAVGGLRACRILLGGDQGVAPPVLLAGSIGVESEAATHGH